MVNQDDQPGRVRGSHLVRLVRKDQAVILKSLNPIFVASNSAREDPNTSANPQHLDLFPSLLSPVFTTVALAPFDSSGDWQLLKIASKFSMCRTKNGHTCRRASRCTFLCRENDCNPIVLHLRTCCQSVYTVSTKSTFCTSLSLYASPVALKEVSAKSTLGSSL